MDFILAPCALILAVVALIQKDCRRNWWSAASFVCIGAEMLMAIYDINRRVAANDIGGIIDIYPTMAVIYTILLVLVTGLNAAAIIGRKNGKMQK